MVKNVLGKEEAMAGLKLLNCNKCGHNVLHHVWTHHPRPRPADYKRTPVGCSVTKDGQPCDCTGYEPLPKA